MKITTLRQEAFFVSTKILFLLSVFFVLISTTLSAQRVFDKFEQQDNIATVIINKKMFEMIKSIRIDTGDEETQKYYDLMTKLDYLRVFTTQNNRAGADMKSAAMSYAKTAKLDELLTLNEDGRKIKILIKSDAKVSIITELLLFVEAGNDEKSVLMSLVGNFNLEDLAIVTNKLHLPGAEALKKITKQN